LISDIVRWQPVHSWGVLCIDCWHDHGSHNDFYSRALEHLQDYNIEIVVNCSTGVEISYQDRSVYNTLRRYLWQPVHDDQRINDRILNNMIKKAGNNATSKILNEAVFQDSTVHITDRETFLHNASITNDRVRDWIILGAAWNICAHHGPLGITTLVDMNTMKFHFFPEWSIQTEDQQAPSEKSIHDDYVVWAPIPNNGYRLITLARNHKWTETT
jgi:hypothetical protein